MNTSNYLHIPAHSESENSDSVSLLVEPSMKLGVDIESLDSIVTCHEMDESRQQCRGRSFWLDVLKKQAIQVGRTQVAVVRHRDKSYARFYGKSDDGRDAFVSDFIPFESYDNEFVLKVDDSIASLRDISH